MLTIIKAASFTQIQRTTLFVKLACTGYSRSRIIWNNFYKIQQQTFVLNLIKKQLLLRTILKDSLNVKSVRGTCFIVRASLDVTCQLPGPCVVDHTWVTFADRILSPNEDERNILDVAMVVCHFRIEAVDGMKTLLIFKTEDKDDSIHPVRKLCTIQNIKTHQHIMVTCVAVKSP